LETDVSNPAGKILSRDDLPAVRSEAKQAGRTIVFTNGCYDLLHRGHLHCFLQARGEGDILVVGVNSDRSVRELKGPKRPLQSEEDRALLVAALEPVSYVVVFDEPTPEKLIRALEPDVLVKGAEYASNAIVGADVVEAAGGRVVRIPMIKERSTRALIRTIVARYAEQPCNQHSPP
jgi:rfaE bifunctional protein nucleotidyltransferase chain/domain